jgi:hypothetical protein
MSRHDEERLHDILDAIRAIRKHLERGDLSDGLIYDAVRMRLIDIPDPDLPKIHKYAARVVPPDFQDQIRIEVDVRGKTVTILECRPPWRGRFWTRVDPTRSRLNEIQFREQ